MQAQVAALKTATQTLTGQVNSMVTVMASANTTLVSLKQTLNDTLALVAGGAELSAEDIAQFGADVAKLGELSGTIQAEVQKQSNAVTLNAVTN